MIINAFSCPLRPFLDKLKEMGDKGQLKRKSKLQLISTDTWDISDDLSSYSDIANILQVIFLKLPDNQIPYRDLELHHHR